MTELASGECRSWRRYAPERCIIIERRQVRIWPLPEVRRSAAYGGTADGFGRRATAPYDPEQTFSEANDRTSLSQTIALSPPSILLA